MGFSPWAPRKPGSATPASNATRARRTLVAEQALAPSHRDALVPCTPRGTVDAQCAEDFVLAVGRTLFRRELTDAEAQDFAAIAVAVAEDPKLADFHLGLEFALAALLQSPDFLYRVEVGSPEGDGTLRFDDVEMASRLAYFFWGVAPDAELLDLAEADLLSDPATLEVQVDRLIADERIRGGVRAFFEEMLKLHKLPALEKDPSVLTAYSAELGLSAREQTLRDLERLIIEEDDDFRRFLTDAETHVDRTLAAVYRTPAPSIEAFAMTTLPEEQNRVGFLGQASFLALNSHAGSTSAVKRGKFVQEVFRCTPILPPPPNVNTTLPPASEELATLRERVAVHLSSPACAGCHQMMDPIGLAFENFDALGSFRAEEQGATIDPSGELNGVAFDTPEELARVLADDPAFTQCVVQTVYRYATGRSAGPGDTIALQELAQQFEESRHRVLALMRAIAVDPRFWLAATQAGDDATRCEPSEEKGT